MVMKLGGTSVGNSEMVEQTASIIRQSLEGQQQEELVAVEAGTG